jgi:uncharacterized protein YecT (DUF1311 family)
MMRIAGKMKRYILLMALLVSSVAAVLGQTEQTMNEQAARKMNKAEEELNLIYQKVVKEYAQDTAFIVKLRISQRIWIQFREAELNMKYPGNPMDYGTIWPMCFASYKEQLTRDRIKTLKQWLDGEEEGDVCNGSVKTISKKQ